jgi:hypothetical protein
MELKNTLGFVFLALSLAVTLWAWGLFAGFRVPTGEIHGQGAGLALAIMITLGRGLALVAAFFLLLQSSSWWFARWLASVGGIVLFEVLIFMVESRSIDPNGRTGGDPLPTDLRLLFKMLVLLLPLIVMAGGYFRSWVLFVIGLVGAAVAATAPLPKYKAPAADPFDLPQLLTSMHSDEIRNSDVILERLERRSNWVALAARSLEASNDTNLNAAYLLSLKPAALGEGLQERCWKAAIHEFNTSEKPALAAGQYWGMGNTEQLANTVKTLAAMPGPVRERHRADFAAIRDAVDFYRLKAPPPERRRPNLPDLRAVDWMASPAPADANK